MPSGVGAVDRQQQHHTPTIGVQTIRNFEFHSDYSSKRMSCNARIQYEYRIVVQLSMTPSMHTATRALLNSVVFSLLRC